MPSNPEIWDVLDPDRNATGLTIRRGEPLLAGQFHLVVHIWPAHEDRFLIQRRADHLETMPAIWATTGGSAIQGEDSLAAALRELQEELGICVGEDQMFRKFVQRRGDAFVDVWVLPQEIDAAQCRLEDAVAEVRWASKSEILEMVARGEFYDYGESYFAGLFG